MALSAPSPRKSDEDINLAYYPVAASAVCYQGGFAVLSSTGFVQPGTAASGLTAVGIFDFSDGNFGTVDNTGGADGAVNARVRNGIFCFTNKSGDLVVEADVGQFCYIYDDTTVCHTSTSKSVAGIVKRVDTQGVWVWIGAAFGSALAAEISARQAIAPDAGITGTQAATTLGTGVAGMEVVLKLTKSGDITGNTDLVVADKIEIIGVSVVKTGTTGGTGDTVQLISGTGSNAITDAMDLSSKATGAKVRDASISQTYNTIAAGGTLRLAGVKGGSGASCACVAYVAAMRVA